MKDREIHDTADQLCEKLVGYGEMFGPYGQGASRAQEAITQAVAGVGGSAALANRLSEQFAASLRNLQSQIDAAASASGKLVDIAGEVNRYLTSSGGEKIF